MALYLNISKVANELMASRLVTERAGNRYEGGCAAFMRLEVRFVKKVAFLALSARGHLSEKKMNEGLPNVSSDGKRSKLRMTPDVLATLTASLVENAVKAKNGSQISLIEGDKFLIEELPATGFYRLVPVGDGVDTFGMATVTITGKADQEDLDTLGEMIVAPVLALAA